MTNDDWEDYEWSPATLGIVSVVEAARDCKLSLKSRIFIEEQVQDYYFDHDCPSWVVEFFSAILEKRFTASLVYINPSESADFSGVLAEIEGKYLDHYEDYGEGIEWNIPNRNILIFLCRETRGPNYFYCIRPLNENINNWLGEQYKKS